MVKALIGSTKGGRHARFEIDRLVVFTKDRTWHALCDRIHESKVDGNER